MTIQTYIIDAFTDTAFKGNPAGVCLLESAIDETLMQSIAAELNLSETAFLIKNHNLQNTYHIRYFTPQLEIAFCGHATLASSKLMQVKEKLTEVTFQTHHNLTIPVMLANGIIKMNFPIYYLETYKATESIFEGLGITKYVSTGYAKELDMAVIEVADADIVRNLNPNFNTLLNDRSRIKELVITAVSDNPEYDFISRCFCPWAGVNEDPVTGAAHSVLSGYWKNKLNKNSLSAYQASKRGGSMQINILNEYSIEVIGEAVIILKGEITA
jgi:PhzF family phenazine biosynthesis protein